jgi:hypothetical protein
MFGKTMRNKLFKLAVGLLIVFLLFSALSLPEVGSGLQDIKTVEQVHRSEPHFDYEGEALLVYSKYVTELNEFYASLMLVDLSLEVDKAKEAERQRQREIAEAKKRQAATSSRQSTTPSAPSATVPSTPPAPSGGSVWDALARCESGGNWSMNSGNGYYGGIQFLHSTWVSMGGRNYAEYPHQATREQQIAVAETLLSKYGWGQWPACSRKLGLR